MNEIQDLSLILKAETRIFIKAFGDAGGSKGDQFCGVIAAQGKSIDISS